MVDKKKKLFLYLGLMVLGVSVAIKLKEGRDFFRESPPFSLKRHYQHPLAVASIFQDEEEHIVQWVEFHKLVGVNHFYLYDNLSTDMSMELLTPYIQRGEVEVIQWPYDAKEKEEWEQVRLSAYNHALTKAKGKAMWLAFLDVDDYLFPSSEESLSKVLMGYSKKAALGVNRLHFGASENGEKKNLLIEALCHRKLIRCEENRSVQPIVRPERVVGFTSENYLSCLPGYQMTTLSGTPIKGKQANEVLASPLRINHYFCRDLNFLVSKKIDRRKEGAEPIEKTVDLIKESYQVEDRSIERFARQLRKAHPFP